MKFTASNTNIEYLSRFLMDLSVEQATVSISINNGQFRRLIESPYWPQAVSPVLIVDQNDEQAKVIRARTILNSFITMPVITGKKFLDFGCGEGHLVKLASTYTSLAMGYDPEITIDNDLLTSNIDIVKSNAPYDVIVVYDVLDHVESHVMRQNCAKFISELLAPNGVGIVRVHPFSSRHASHVYPVFNKAYAHLIYTHDEMVELGYAPEPLLKTLRPLKFYRELWKNVGLNVLNENATRQPVDDFFTTPDMLQFFIDKHWYVDQEVSANHQWLMDILSLQFIDYKLSK